MNIDHLITKEVLDALTNEASTKDVDLVYKQLSLKHHPDRGGDKESFQILGATCDFAKTYGARYAKMLYHVRTMEVCEDEPNLAIASYSEHYERANIDDFEQFISRLTQGTTSKATTTVRPVSSTFAPGCSAHRNVVPLRQSAQSHLKRKLRVRHERKLCQNVMGGNLFCFLVAGHQGACETISSKCKAFIKNKSIVLYGKDKLARRWGISARPRLLIQNASADLDNLSSRVLKETCFWLDGPLSNMKPTTLCKAVNMAYANAGFTNSNNAYIEILVDPCKNPEELYCIAGFRKGYMSKTGWIAVNGGGFAKFL